MRHSTGQADDACSHDDERDALTATLSRPAFVARLRARAEHARHSATTFALCLVDLDHFKKINLSHGPACGDGALRDVAARLVRTTAATLAHEIDPVVARYDGDTFAVLAETTSHDGLTKLAEALRHSIASTPAPGGAWLSASVGAALARIGEPADALLVRAEQALFLAKQCGRDRVEVAMGPAPKGRAADVLPLPRLV